MYSSLTAVVLCIAMQTTAAAQCVAPEGSPQHTRPGADLIKKTTVVTAPPLATARSGGELIKTAAAGMHDEVPGIARSAPPAVASAQNDDQHSRSGSGMLLAALALMSGIALRRFGAHKQ